MTNKEKFALWMRDRVKSIHFANNEKMYNAYCKIDEYGK